MNSQEAAKDQTASSRVWINGMACDYLGAQDRGLQYGDGLFETILCRGRQLYYWPQHYQRLQQSAARLQLACPAQDVWLADIARCFDALPAVTGMEAGGSIKLVLTRGDSERGYAYSRDGAPRRLLYYSALPAGYSSLLDGRLHRGALSLCRTRVSINPDLAGLKHLGRLENVLARNEFGREYIDGLMCDADGRVIEGSMSNLFALGDGQVFTPALDRSGVAGIMRDRIITIVEQQLSLPLQIGELSPEDLNHMDALFISNSLIGLYDISHLQQHAFAAGSQPLVNDIFSQLLADSQAHCQSVYPGQHV